VQQAVPISPSEFSRRGHLRAGLIGEQKKNYTDFARSKDDTMQLFPHNFLAYVWTTLFFSLFA
jgi:hypothetical protein